MGLKLKIILPFPGRKTNPQLLAATTNTGGEPAAQGVLHYSREFIYLYEIIEILFIFMIWHAGCFYPIVTVWHCGHIH